MSAPTGTYRYWTEQATLNGATPVTVHTCHNSTSTSFVTKLTLSIITHAASAQAVTVSDTTPTTIAVHTDTAAAAGIPSNVTWDFGSSSRIDDLPRGLQLGTGKNLQVVTTASGPSAILYAEGYDVVPNP